MKLRIMLILGTLNALVATVQAYIAFHASRWSECVAAAVIAFVWIVWTGLVARFSTLGDE